MAPGHVLRGRAGGRAGGASQPARPAARVAAKLADSGARVLVTTNLPGLPPVALDLLAAGAVDRVLVGDDAEWGTAPAAIPIPDSARVSPLAALMSVGGATGRSLGRTMWRYCNTQAAPPASRARRC